MRGQLPETGITVAGTYRKLGTGTNRVQRLLNSGLVWIEQGCVQSLLSTDSPGYTQTAGELRLAGGTLDVRLGPATSTQPGRILITGGAVSGTGKITGDLTLDGGTLQPGAGPGLLEVQGQVNWRPNGVFSVEIGGATPGSEHDQLVAATCDFDGVLEIVLRNGFQPQIGDTFEIAKFTGRSARNFREVRGTEIGPGRCFDVVYERTSLKLRVAP